MIARTRQFARALALRCPLCGKPWPRAWPSLGVQCHTCQLYLERRENDAFLGSYSINLLATLVVAAVVSYGIVRWAAVAPWVRYAVSFLVITGFAIAFHPVSKLLWLAADLQFRPAMERDFDEIDNQPR